MGLVTKGRSFGPAAPKDYDGKVSDSEEHEGLIESVESVDTTQQTVFSPENIDKGFILRSGKVFPVSP
jgi:hypothetical protein